MAAAAARRPKPARVHHPVSQREGGVSAPEETCQTIEPPNHPCGEQESQRDGNGNDVLELQLPAANDLSHEPDSRKPHDAADGDRWPGGCGPISATTTID